MLRETADCSASDADLVQRAQRGDSSAMASLVLRYQDRIYNVAFRMCRNRETAADITQSTFLKAIQALPRFETRASIYTWLFRIATNLCISGLRQRKRSAVSLDQDAHAAERIPDRQPRLVTEDMEQREMMEKLEAALAELDEEYKAAVVLRDVEGLDYAQISEVLQLPVGTVKSRIHRGRLLLKKRLLDEDQDEHTQRTNAV